MTYKKRILICTLFALGLGLSGGYVAGQISLSGKKQQCQTWLNSPQFQSICNYIIVPPLAVNETVTGLWTGTILGAFIAGLVTRKRKENLTADEHR